jgi:VIT1/CCC1 family predicted Fe2+/Mn2+ transporter
MLYVLVPIYFVFGLLLVIFTILFSPSGLSNDADVSVWEGANLASSILVTGVSITILFFILALSIRKQHWNSGGVGSCYAPSIRVFSLTANITRRGP